MSSEAAAYFPETLASTAEVRRVESCAHIPFAVPSSEIQSQEIDHVRAVANQTAQMSDETLLKQTQQGAKEALSLLFKRHARMVRSVAHRILRNEAEADDLVQDVFIFLFHKAALFDESRGSAKSWIVHVTYHRAFDRRRYLTTRHFYKNHDAEHDVLKVADPRSQILPYEWSLEGVWGRESAAKLREFLSSDQLKTIELFFFEGCTLEEIAERTGQTLGNIRNHYYRGLEKLRKPAFTRNLRSK
jgi:RNA polymerase sigma-70 factor (ECF subfamily)